MEHENRPFSGQKVTSDHHKYSEPKHRQIAPKLSQLIEFMPQGWIFGRIYTFGRQFAFLGRKLLILDVLMIYENTLIMG